MATAKILIKCGHCKKPFLKAVRTIRKYAKRGRRTFYCSTACSCASRRKAGEKRTKRTERTCPVCEKTFVVKVTEKKKTCSHGCSNTFFRKGKRISKKSSYRAICFRWHKRQCLICGEDKVVAVHHYDHNRKNNKPENLVPLCPTHHQYVHSRFVGLVKPKIDSYVRRFKKTVV